MSFTALLNNPAFKPTSAFEYRMIADAILRDVAVNDLTHSGADITDASVHAHVSKLAQRLPKTGALDAAQQKLSKELFARGFIAQITLVEKGQRLSA
jgi:hypothetical protein